MRLAVYAVPVVLVLFALIDLSRSNPDERVGIRSFAWGLIIVLLPVVGPIVWVLVSRLHGLAESPQPPAPLRQKRIIQRRRPGPVAPDDDPDFLRLLDEQRHRSEGTDNDSTDGRPAGN